MDRRDFLTELFGSIPDDSRFFLWELASHGTRWFTDIDQADQYAATHNENIYVGVSLGKNGLRGKPKSDDSAGIVGLYADIDIRGPAHKSENLPETVEEARALVEGYGFDPSIIVHSGHGLQAWWLFKEPWVFDSDEERQEAAKLSHRLIETIRARADIHDWRVDGVFDLARVMRLPDTVNIKDGIDPVTAAIIHSTALRYNPEDFEEFLVEVPEKQKVKEEDRQVVADGLTLALTAAPPAHKLDGLLELDAKFKKTWNNDRDPAWTPSEYDLSLASMAADSGWEAQEIADLIIAFRRRHNLNPEKCLRVRYMADTIARARTLVGTGTGTGTGTETASLTLDRDAEPPVVKLDEMLDINPDFKTAWKGLREDLTSPEKYDRELANTAFKEGWDEQEIANLIIAHRRRHGHPMPDEKYMVRTLLATKHDLDEDAAMEQVEHANLVHGTPFATDQTWQETQRSLKTLLGIDILWIDMYKGDNPTYVLHTSQGEIKLPTIEDLIRFPRFQSRIAIAIKDYITVSTRRWPAIAKLLLKLVREIDVDEENFEVGKVKAWVRDYLEGKPELDKDEGGPTWKPFVHNGCWYIFPDAFHAWAMRNKGCRDKKTDLTRAMTRLGCTSIQIRVKGDGKNKWLNRKPWKVPAQIVCPACTDDND